MSTGGALAPGRSAALAILAVLLVAFWLGPVSAYVDWVQGLSAETEQKSALLARYKSLAETASRDQPAPATPGNGDMLLPDIPDSQALATLQERVKGLADKAQVQIQGLQVLKTEPVSGAVRVGVRLRASGDVASLGRLLHGLEAARPLLVSDNLTVQSRGLIAAGAATGSNVAATAPTPLDFQLDIAAFKSGGSS